MTIDEHIHKAEEDAKMAEFDMEWGIGNYFIDRTEALEYAKECRQLAEWLKDYKRLKEQEPKIGYWYVNEWGNITCSKCGCGALYDKVYPGESVFGKAIRVKSTFCPTCGARMEVEQNG